MVAEGIRERQLPMLVTLKAAPGMKEWPMQLPAPEPEEVQAALPMLMSRQLAHVRTKVQLPKLADKSAALEKGPLLMLVGMLKARLPR